MHHLHHHPLDTGSYVLPNDYYETLCEMRDKLTLLAQLTGTGTAADNHSTLLLIQRALIGQLFVDLCFQITDVLNGITHATAAMNFAQTHSS